MNRTALWLGFRMSLGARSGRWFAVASAVTAFVSTVLMLAILAAVHVHSAERRRAVARSPYSSSAGALLYESWFQPDSWHGKALTRVLVGASGPGAVLPPGVSVLPKPGQVVLSPRLAQLRDHDADMRVRFPTAPVAIVGRAGLTNPDELIAYQGMDASTLTALHADRVRRFGNASPVSTTSGGLSLSALLLFIGFIAVPLAATCGLVTRLAATACRRRLIALRIVGASASTVRTVVCVEATVAACAGTTLGLAGFWALRPVAAHLSFGGSRHYLADMSPSPLGSAVIVVGVCVLALASGYLAAGDVKALPMAARPTMKPHRTRSLSLVPLAVGLLLLAGIAVAETDGWLSGQSLVKMLDLASVFVVAGLALSLPAVAQRAANLAVRTPLTNWTANLLAARRLGTDPGTVTRVSSLFAAMLFAAVFACCLSSAFTLDTSGAQAALTQGGRTVANVETSFVNLNVTALQRAEPSGVAIAVTSVNSGTATVGSAMVGDCKDWHALTGSISCPTKPVTVTSTQTPGATANGPKPGTPLTIRSAPDKTFTFPAPASMARIEVPPNVNLPGTLWVPSPLPADTSQPLTAGSAIVLIAPTSAARERLDAAVAQTNPWATVQYPGLGVITSASTYRGYGNTILYATAMGCAVALVALVAATAAMIAGRRRTTTALRVTGAPIRVLSISNATEVAAASLLGFCVAIAAGILAGHTYLSGRDLGTPFSQTGQIIAIAIVLGFALSSVAGWLTRSTSSGRPLREE